MRDCVFKRLLNISHRGKSSLDLYEILMNWSFLWNRWLFSCLYFAKKSPRKTKNFSRLLEPQKFAPNAKSCQAQSEQAYLYLHYRDVCTWNTSDFVTNSCGESWDSSFFFCPSLEPMSPSSKGNGSSLENQMKMLGLLCNQTVNLKTDSKTLYDSILKSKYSSSILKHNKG